MQTADFRSSRGGSSSNNKKLKAASARCTAAAWQAKLLAKPALGSDVITILLVDRAKVCRNAFQLCEVNACIQCMI